MAGPRVSVLHWVVIESSQAPSRMNAPAMNMVPTGFSLLHVPHVALDPDGQAPTYG